LLRWTLRKFYIILDKHFVFGDRPKDAASLKSTIPPLLH
jgi:hypothetical protein